MRKLLVIVSFFTAGAVHAQSLTRKAAFAKGQQLEKTTVMKMNMNMEMMGQSLEMVNNNTMTSLLEVKNTTDKEVVIANTIKRIVAHASSMGQEMDYDSDKPEDANNDMGKMMGSSVGKTSHVTIDKKGFVTANDDSSLNEVAKKAGGMMGFENGGFASPNKVGASFDGIGNLPEKPLKIGDTWADSTVEKNSPNKVVTNYKLVAINGGEAQIALDGTVAKTIETEQSGMTMTVTMKGKTTGTYTMDVASGIIRKRNMQLDATGSMEMAGQSIPYTMKMTSEENIAKK